MLGTIIRGFNRWLGKGGDASPVATARTPKSSRSPSRTRPPSPGPTDIVETPSARPVSLAPPITPPTPSAPPSPRTPHGSRRASMEALPSTTRVSRTGLPLAPTAVAPEPLSQDALEDVHDTFQCLEKRGDPSAHEDVYLLASVLLQAHPDDCNLATWAAQGAIQAGLWDAARLSLQHCRALGMDEPWMVGAEAYALMEQGHYAHVFHVLPGKLVQLHDRRAVLAYTASLCLGGPNVNPDGETLAMAWLEKANQLGHLTDALRERLLPVVQQHGWHGAAAVLRAHEPFSEAKIRALTRGKYTAGILGHDRYDNVAAQPHTAWAMAQAAFLANKATDAEFFARVAQSLLVPDDEAVAEADRPRLEAIGKLLEQAKKAQGVAPKETHRAAMIRLRNTFSPRNPSYKSYGKLWDIADYGPQTRKLAGLGPGIAAFAQPTVAPKQRQKNRRPRQTPRPEVLPPLAHSWDEVYAVAQRSLTTYEGLRRYIRLALATFGTPPNGLAFQKQYLLLLASKPSPVPLNPNTWTPLELAVLAPGKTDEAVAVHAYDAAEAGHKEALSQYLWQCYGNPKGRLAAYPVTHGLTCDPEERARRSMHVQILQEAAARNPAYAAAHREAANNLQMYRSSNDDRIF